MWDVVDVALRRPKPGQLKIANMGKELDEAEAKAGVSALDASFVDVYRGAHGAVFLFDLTDEASWQYVVKEAPKVPSTLPILSRCIGGRVVFCRDSSALLFQSLATKLTSVLMEHVES